MKKRKNFVQKLKVIGVNLAISGTIFFLGYIALFSGLDKIDQAKSSTTWPSVPGTIVQSQMLITDDDTDDNEKKDPLAHATVIIYRYQIDGKWMMGNRVSWNTTHTDEIAKQRMRAYPLDKTVQVYYSPDNPSLSILEPGYTKDLLLLPSFGAVCIVISLLCTLIFWKYGNHMILEMESMIGNTIVVKILFCLLLVGAGLLVFYILKFK